MNLIVRSALAGFSIASLLAAVTVAEAQKPASSTKAVPYTNVNKIFQAKCVGCHQGAKPAGQIDLSSYASVAKSKFKGKPIVVAKNVKGSVLVDALHGHGVPKMPPGPGLPAADIKTIEAWIASGAKK